MKLAMFRVTGFKNFTAPVELTALGNINVIHGDNNVGKSNLLEAMRLFFFILGRANKDGFIPIADDMEIAATDEVVRGTPLFEAFNLDAPIPIVLEATLETNPDEFTKEGIRQLLPATEVTVGLRLELLGDRVGIRITRFRFADGTDASALLESAEKKAYTLRFARFLARSHLVDQNSTARFILIDTGRSSDTRTTARVSPLTQDLCLALYDAKEAIKHTRHQGWSRFSHAMTSLTGHIEGGHFTVVYEREAARAHLVLQRPSRPSAQDEVRIHAHLLGSGIQQIASLLGLLVTSGSSIAAIEEPELNIRYSLQVCLRDLLIKEIVGKPGCPAQIFLTSHSPAFEVGSHFYAMVKGPDGPIIRRRPRSEARMVTGVDAELPPNDEVRGPGFVSSDGLLALPERVRKTLGLLHGGGVMFVDRADGCVELVSDSSFLARLGTTDDTK